MKRKNISVSLALIMISMQVAIQDSIAKEHDHTHHDHNHAHFKKNSPFYGHLDIQVHADSVKEAGGSDKRYDDVYTHSHLELGAILGNGISINTNIKIEGEPSGHSHSHHSHSHSHHSHSHSHHKHSNNRLFKDHPLLVEQLTLNYDRDHFLVYVGKFNPVIGFNYHDFPGIYGYQTIEGYSIREKIGLGGALKYHAGNYGDHKLDFSTFIADRTILSDSIMFKRGRTTKEKGGVSNSESLSYAISMSGSNFYSLNNNIVEGLSYRLGYAKQAADINSKYDETRHSISFAYRHQLSKELIAKLLFEYMNINHLNGEEKHNRSHNTLALKLSYKKWNIGSSYSYIKNKKDASKHPNDNVFQISAGYIFDNNIGFDIGYQRKLEENKKTKRTGLLLSYNYEF